MLNTINQSQNANERKSAVSVGRIVKAVGVSQNANVRKSAINVERIVKAVGVWEGSDIHYAAPSGKTSRSIGAPRSPQLRPYGRGIGVHPGNDCEASDVRLDSCPYPLEENGNEEGVHESVKYDVKNGFGSTTCEVDEAFAFVMCEEDERDVEFAL